MQWCTVRVHLCRRLCALSLQAVVHYGEALKALVNEGFGDGIMSASEPAKLAGWL